MPFTLQATSWVGSDCKCFFLSSCLTYLTYFCCYSPPCVSLWRFYGSNTVLYFPAILHSSVLSFIFPVCSLIFWGLGNNLVSVLSTVTSLLILLFYLFLLVFSDTFCICTPQCSYHKFLHQETQQLHRNQLFYALSKWSVTVCGSYLFFLFQWLSLTASFHNEVVERSLLAFSLWIPCQLIWQLIKWNSLQDPTGKESDFYFINQLALFTHIFTSRSISKCVSR